MPALVDDIAANRHDVARGSLSDLLARLQSSVDGLTTAEARQRLATVGPNSVRTHRVSALAVLVRQLNNAVLALLAVTAVLSFFLGDSTQAIIIGIILLISIGGLRYGYMVSVRVARPSHWNIALAFCSGTSPGGPVQPPRSAARTLAAMTIGVVTMTKCPIR